MWLLPGTDVLKHCAQAFSLPEFKVIAKALTQILKPKLHDARPCRYRANPKLLLSTSLKRKSPLQISPYFRRTFHFPNENIKIHMFELPCAKYQEIPLWQMCLNPKPSTLTSRIESPGCTFFANRDGLLIFLLDALWISLETNVLTQFARRLLQ